MKRFFTKLKGVGIKDILSLFLFALAYPVAAVYRKKRKNMWLVCEYENEARDNGRWFYEYVRRCHREQDIVYAINPKSDDYEKVSAIGEVVPYGSFRHWIYYLAASVNISSQKGGKPNAAACYLLEVYGILKNKRVFLQHGITKDLADMFFYENTKMRLFICGAKPEYDFVKKEFGYPEENVKYTGFARFDRLLEKTETKRQVLIAPTWRSFLRTSSSDPYKKDSNKNITESEYFKTWASFLKSPRLGEICEKYGLTVKFYPHRNVAHCFDSLTGLSEKIEIAYWEQNDLQVLMRESLFMITDYSSAVMDFAYMEKPVLYYHFDYEKYRAGHLAEGYFNYERDGFGRVVYNENDLIRETEALAENPVMTEEYRMKLDKFFPLRDTNNCERIYEEIKKL